MDPLHPWLDHYPDGVDWHAPIPAAPLYAMMQQAGEQYGDRPAFDFLGRGTTWSEAAATAARIAAGLQRLGYAKGDRIGCCCQTARPTPCCSSARCRPGSSL